MAAASISNVGGSSLFCSNHDTGMKASSSLAAMAGLATSVSAPSLPSNVERLPESRKPEYSRSRQEDAVTDACAALVDVGGGPVCI